MVWINNNIAQTSCLFVLIDGSHLATSQFSLVIGPLALEQKQSRTCETEIILSNTQIPNISANKWYIAKANFSRSLVVELLWIENFSNHEQTTFSLMSKSGIMCSIATDALRLSCLQYNHDQ